MFSRALYSGDSHQVGFRRACKCLCCRPKSATIASLVRFRRRSLSPKWSASAPANGKRAGEEQQGRR